MFPKINAFIFDLDGVITDTAEYHYQAWSQLAQEIGIIIDRDFNEQLKGVSRVDSLEKILTFGNKVDTFSQEEKEMLCEKKNDHYKQLISNITPKDILPGIVPLLEEIKCRNIPIAIGSASKNAGEIINRLGLKEYFDYIVDAAKVHQGKPHPETFTIAADYLQVPYNRCIGIEDSVAGIKAIKAASMFAVGVGSHTILHEADLVAKTTNELYYPYIEKEFNHFIKKDG